MFAKVLSVGAEAINQLTRLLPFIEQDNLFEQTLPFLQTADDTVDAQLRMLGGDDGVSLRSIHAGGANFLFGDGSVRNVFQRFVLDVLAAMQVGVNNENWMALAGVPLPSERSSAIFNFADLRTLTAMWVTDPKQERALLMYLDRAEAAGGRGDHGHVVPWLDEYTRALSFVYGTEVPAVNADALIQNANTLKSAAAR